MVVLDRFCFVFFILETKWSLVALEKWWSYKLLYGHWLGRTQHWSSYRSVRLNTFDCSFKGELIVAAFLKSLSYERKQSLKLFSDNF